MDIGIIGYGYWGPNLSRNFSESPRCSVVAISDPKRERLAQAKIKHPGAKFYDDYGAMLSDCSVDAVAIATPVSSHYQIALDCLRAGKHVFLEKPMAETEDQCEELIREAARRNLVLMVDHTFIYTGAVRKIKEVIDRGDIGDLLYYDSVRVNLGLFQHDVNVLWDLAVHDLSIMDYFFGLPVSVSAIGVSHLEGLPEDMAYLTCLFQSGAIAHIHASWMSPVKIRKTLIGGSKQMIAYDDLEPSEKIKVYDRGVSLSSSSWIDYRSGDMWCPKLDSAEALKSEAKHFIDCVHGVAHPLSDGESGLRVVRVLHAANKSLSQKGKMISI